MQTPSPTVSRSRACGPRACGAAMVVQARLGPVGLGCRGQQVRQGPVAVRLQ